MTTENTIAKREEAKISSDEMARQVFTTLTDAVSNPDIDADKLEKLLNIQVSLIDRQRKEEFDKSLNAACFEMPVITRRGAIKNNAGRVQSRYSTWSDLQSVIYPILRKHNLRMSHDIDSDNNGRVVVILKMSHANGYSETGGRSVWAIDSSGSKNNTQGAGSAASYGQRHTAIKYLGIMEMDVDDNDGQGGKSVQLGMTVDEKRIIADGETAALKGVGEYTEWYKSQSNMVRGWLVDNGHHDDFKAKAGS